MRNRRGKLDIPYLAIFSGILIVAVVASLILFPEWRQSPATMVALLVAAVGGIVGLAANFRQAFIRDKDDAPPAALDYDSPQHRRNQENVCANVRLAWIDGVLRESLPERVRLELALDSLPGMLQRTMVLVEGREPRRKPVSDEHIADLFRSSGRALLILGAPGSGKTVTLLELCRPILEGAEVAPSRPVPVVLNLSTWAQKQAPLEAWIADEMFRQYGLNRKVTPVWLAADHLILLLDGLDEVAPDARDVCVRAINAFREKHGAGMAVCSRSADYAELRQRLALSRAVEIRPLEQAQIDAYLGDERLELTAVRQAVAQDDALRELATTPLMLNVMAVAYRGLPFDALLPLLDGQTERRAHLYDAYLARVFARRPLAAAGYTAAQALRWLRFLSARLTERDETQFFIEDIQLGWLPGKRRRQVGVLSRILIGGLVGMVAGGLIGVVVSGLVGALDVVLIGGVAGVVLVQITGRGAIEPVDSMETDFSKHSIGRVIRSVVLGGVLGGVLFGVLGSVLGTLSSALSVTLGGVLIGVFAGGLVGVRGELVRPVQSKRRQRPNQGIRRSAANGLCVGMVVGGLVGVVAGVLVGVLAGVVAGMLDGVEVSVLDGVEVGVLCGPLIGLMFYGGDAVTKHYTLRLVLALYRLLPLRLIPFLETMRERILLQRAGAHYRFVHRTLQEHVAALSDERIEELTR